MAILRVRLVFSGHATHENGATTDSPQKSNNELGHERQERLENKAVRRTPNICCPIQILVNKLVVVVFDILGLLFF